jgi:hypothetical protein
MATFDATIGKEQLILLPVDQKTFTLTTDPSVTVQMNAGGHAVVVSGYARVTSGGTSETQLMGGGGFFLKDVDDDETFFDHDVSFIVGPAWRDIVQVSASVSPAAIMSHDPDEVDRSWWEVVDCAWEAVEVPDGKKIRLTINIRTRGDGNGWVNFAYQVVATGWLRRMPTPDEISADL